LSGPSLFSWIDVIQNSIGQVLPNVTVTVLAGTVGGSSGVNTTNQPGTPLATIYSDPYGADPINQSTSPLNTSAGNGQFQFWAPAGYYVIQAYGPGIQGQLVFGICLGGSGGGGGGGSTALLFNLPAENANFTAAIATGNNPTNYYQVTTGSSKIVAQLPSAIGIAGQSVLFQKIDSGSGRVSVTPVGGQTTGGLTSFSLTAQYQFVGLVSDGTNWQIFSRN
jgi:hypothetical protein